MHFSDAAAAAAAAGMLTCIASPSISRWFQAKISYRRTASQSNQ